jgi:selenocysteine lyase/cysteine desulfurase
VVLSSAARLGDRSLFPDLQALAYCNHAGISPPSRPVEQAVARVLGAYAREGVGALAVARTEREQLRQRCAHLIGALPDEVALTSGTTRGVQDIALGLPWKNGDRIVLLDGEFPTNVTPWQAAAREFGLEIVWLRTSSFEAGDGLSDLTRALGAGVRLVAVSAVQFQSGFHMPLEEIGKLCREHGAELFVDAIQALGIVPFDVRRYHVDYLSSGGHKWLMGLEGVGFLYVRSECARALQPRTIGWLSHEDADGFLWRGAGHLRYDRPLRRDARVFEGGSANVIGQAALGASLQLIQALGIEPIFAHVQRWHDTLEPALLERGFESLRSRFAQGRSGTLSVRPPSGADAIVLHRALTDAGIACALPDGILRFSPHWPNAIDEVPLIVSQLDFALNAARG